MNGFIYIITSFVFALATCCSTVNTKNHEEVSDEHSSMIMISDQDRLLANISTIPASVKSISETTTLVGTAVINEQKVNVLTARVNGRIEKLLVDNPGEYVKKGQAIYAIYSEELLSDENEYLLALAQYDSSFLQKELALGFVQSAKRKLLRWTLSEKQILMLGKTRVADPIIVFYTPYSGYIVDLNVREGQYVDTGWPILTLSDLSEVWVEAQVYTDEIKYLRQKPSAKIEFESYPSEIFNGSIVFNNPVLENDRKVNLVRISVNNSTNKIRPGMMAYITLSRNEKQALVIPKSALILESSTSVWIEDEDGMFEPRMITTGIENKKEIEVLSGIHEGEKVVVSGAFFLKSESVVRQGGSDMGGMKM